jgi:hypothetical protein
VKPSLLYSRPAPVGTVTVIVPVVVLQFGCTILSIGAIGVVFGAATAEPGKLVHPFTVCVTLNAPPLLTVMDEPEAPVLHNRFPVAVVDRIDVPLQVFTTVTTGAGGVPGCALIVAWMDGDRHPAGVFTLTS